MAIDKFVEASDIPPVYYDTSYYLAPDGEAGQDVYAVLRAAIARSGKAALSRVVIARRERAVAIMPMRDGMVLYTLHEKSDIHDPKALFDPVAEEKPDPEMIKLALQLVDRQTAAFTPSDMEDRYEARLREVIAAKLKGEGIRPPSEPEAPREDNVVDLMAVLKRSLGRTADSTRGAQTETSATATKSGGRAGTRKPASAKTASATAKAAALKSPPVKPPPIKSGKKSASQSKLRAVVARASEARKRA